VSINIYDLSEDTITYLSLNS